MRFSRRTAWNVEETELAGAVRRMRAAGQPLLDLTVSNPTRCGFIYPAERLLPPLADPRALVYETAPFGMLSAREGVKQYYRSHDAEVELEDILLTTSTSEGYSFLFRLLCDAGDEVLIAQPSYPLFDFLADLEDVQLRSYPLFYDHGWWIDVAELERQIGPRTRAIIVVHPNNPTGHATGPVEREHLYGLCARFGLALMVDEVFLDYPLDGEAELPTFASGEAPVLTFVLSGMSKVAGLPQMKAAWMAIRGPAPERHAAAERLEVIADTFLSMNAPVQLALPHWMADRHLIQGQIRERTRANLAELRRPGLEVLRTDAGWSAVLRMPQRRRDASVAGEMLGRGVVVQDGSLYGFAELDRIVLSLLTSPAELREGAERLREFAAEG